MAEAFGVGQHHANAFVGLQTQQGARQVQARGGEVALPQPLVLGLGQVVLGDLQPVGRAARLLQPAVHRDAAQPGAEGQRRAQAGQLAPGVDEGLLGQVLGEGGVARQPAHQITHHGLATANEFGEGPVVTRGRQHDDARLGRAGERLRSHRRSPPPCLTARAATISRPTPIMPTRAPTPKRG